MDPVMREAGGRLLDGGMTPEQILGLMVYAEGAALVAIVAAFAWISRWYLRTLAEKDLRHEAERAIWRDEVTKDRAQWASAVERLAELNASLRSPGGPAPSRARPGE